MLCMKPSNTSDGTFHIVPRSRLGIVSSRANAEWVIGPGASHGAPYTKRESREDVAPLSLWGYWEALHARSLTRIEQL